ncbi:hypothetical protein QN277_001001 [Acacia crassicarpa]|uniref:Uncharacterized protein n=1 Tax=Acacia crassicarpa TaxID=499986 RepID=A0AAE1N7R8_9FABA|nr:hypothetical protein QN277_001001 [Acacia crassicarpa]
MVLSNKKLKQKLRAELAQSESANPDCSFKTLLDSATPNILLSKREKRRKVRSLQQPETTQEGGDGRSVDESKEDEGAQKKSRKRKRKAEDSTVENGTVKDAKKSKKKKRDKRKKKNNKKAKTDQEKDANPGDEKLEASELTKSNGREQNVDVPTKVYVGGIPYYSTEDDIQSYFEGCGTITEIDCMTFPETGKFRGIALINFKTEAAAKRALALDGSDMGGLFLKIQPYKTTRTVKASDFAPKPVEGYNRIYVGNLSWNTTEDQLRSLFLSCSISSIRLGMDKETGEFRGYAHVDFTDSQSVKAAVALDQKVMHGRPVRITCAVPLKKLWKQTTTDVPAPMNTEVDGEKPSSTGTGKVKRRTCFECGEMGHISSACPKKQTNDAPAPMNTQVNSEKPSSTGSGKVKRRTCFECGEKGHVFSACPKKQTTDVPVPVPAPTNTQVNGEKPSSTGSGKVKRRTCFECGEKGHISSACPKNQNVASNTS